MKEKIQVVAQVIIGIWGLAWCVFFIVPAYDYCMNWWKRNWRSVLRDGSTEGER